MHYHIKLKTFGLLFLFLSLIILNILFEVNANSKRCEHGFKLSKGNPIEFFVRVPMMVKEEKCIWGIYGEDCSVLLTCSINLPKQKKPKDCGKASNHYVRVTDGSAGSKKFCGKTKFTNVRASPGLRHLFLVVVTDMGKEGDPKTPITCKARCAKKNKDGKKLKKTTLKRKTVNSCVCGIQNKDDRIVGGEDATMDEFPWQAALVYPGTRSPFCGASLINNQFVLTATHCFWFDEKKPSALEVLVHANLLDMTKKKGWKDVALGEKGSIQSPGYNKSKKTDSDEGTLRFAVEEIIMHPLFNENYDYDYALLKLDKKIDLSGSGAPTPICLPEATSFDKELKGWKGKNLTVIGWGLADEKAGGTTRQLQKLDVPYMDYGQCQSANKKLFTDRMICAGFEQGEKDACTGDSGGPLSKKFEKEKSKQVQFMQVGIVSWGIGCARAKKPGFYSRVTEMMQWVHLQTIEHSGTKWCQEYHQEKESKKKKG